MRRFMTLALALAASGCGDDLGATIAPAEALRRQQMAATARATALMCATQPTLSQGSGTATQCSESDTSTCVARINAVTTCDAIIPAYLGCPVRCH